MYYTNAADMGEPNHFDILHASAEAIITRQLTHQDLANYDKGYKFNVSLNDLATIGKKVMTATQMVQQQAKVIAETDYDSDSDSETSFPNMPLRQKHADIAEEKSDFSTVHKIYPNSRRFIFGIVKLLFNKYSIYLNPICNKLKSHLSVL